MGCVTLEPPLPSSWVRIRSWIWILVQVLIITPRFSIRWYSDSASWNSLHSLRRRCSGSWGWRSWKRRGSSWRGGPRRDNQEVVSERRGVLIWVLGGIGIVRGVFLLFLFLGLFLFLPLGFHFLGFRFPLHFWWKRERGWDGNGLMGEMEWPLRLRARWRETEREPLEKGVVQFCGFFFSDRPHLLCYFILNG